MQLAALVVLGVPPAVGQDAPLQGAVDACLKEDPTGGCACIGMSCSSDPRFSGAIGAWDVSGVTNMSRLFVGRIDFNGNISAWDTSRVTTMFQMCACEQRGASARRGAHPG